MIVKTNGIVLNYVKYGDTSIIVRIFTEELGYGSFIVNAIRSARSKKSIGHFQPFSILELVLYIKDTRDLQRISDFKNHLPLHRIQGDFTKSSITLFLTEMLSRLLQQEPANDYLYHFLSESIRTFNDLDQGVENFHLQFLMKIASFLGFGLEEFEVLFTSLDKLVPHQEGAHVWELLINEPYGKEIMLNRQIRNQILDSLIGYYQHHANLAKPKSLDVLRNVLS